MTEGQRRGPTKRVTEHQLAEIAAAYVAGEGAPAIAVRYGVSSWTIRAYLLQAGIAMRKRTDYPYSAPHTGSTLTDQQIAHAVARYQAGDSMENVAAFLGVTGPRVRRALLQAGIQPRPPTNAPNYGKAPHERRCTQCHRNSAEGAHFHSNGRGGLYPRCNDCKMVHRRTRAQGDKASLQLLLRAARTVVAQWAASPHTNSADHATAEAVRALEAALRALCSAD